MGNGGNIHAWGGFQGRYRSGVEAVLCAFLYVWWVGGIEFVPSRCGTARGVLMSVYEPKPLLALDLPSLQRAVAEEFRAVAAATTDDLLGLAVKHVEPSKVFIGLIAY